MSAIIATLASGTAAGGGTGGLDVTPNAIAWDDIQGVYFTANAAQTFSGINAPITLQISGVGNRFSYSKNGGGFVAIANNGTVTVNNTDTLAWGSGLGAGTATVTNISDSSTVLDTFNYDCETNH